MNQGQAIWSEQEGYTLSVQANNHTVESLVSDISTIKPFEEDRMSFTIKTPTEPQTIQLSLQLRKK